MSATGVMIHADNLAKRYGRQQAVQRLTFAVQAGQICALLGPNGAGKTSAMRMLVGLTTPDTGAVHIADVPVSLGAPVLQRVKGYSMGMKQRLVLAQALMRRPEVLILDEPANGIDPGPGRADRPPR